MGEILSQAIYYCLLTTTSSSISPFVPWSILTKLPTLRSQIYKECCRAEPAQMYSPSPEKQHFFHIVLRSQDQNNHSVLRFTLYSDSNFFTKNKPWHKSVLKSNTSYASHINNNQWDRHYACRGNNYNNKYSNSQNNNQINQKKKKPTIN